MSKGSRTDLCGGWPERAIPTATVGVPSMRTQWTTEGSRGLARGVKEVLVEKGDEDGRGQLTLGKSRGQLTLQGVEPWSVVPKPAGSMTGA